MEALLGIALCNFRRSKKVSARDVIAASRCILEYTVIKQSKKDINKMIDRPQGPTIMLPPLREDPALSIVKGGNGKQEKEAPDGRH